jgi:hypothetical protein
VTAGQLERWSAIVGVLAAALFLLAVLRRTQ